MSAQIQQYNDALYYDGGQWMLQTITPDGRLTSVPAEAGMVVGESPQFGLITGRQTASGLEVIPYVPTPFVTGANGTEIPFAGYTVNGFPFYPAVTTDALNTRRRRSFTQTMRAYSRAENFFGKLFRLVSIGSFSASSMAELVITYDDSTGIGLVDNFMQMPVLSTALISGVVLWRKYHKYCWAEPGEEL